jgi:hypothetical protein
MPKGAAIVLESGFHRHDTFFLIIIPRGATAALTEIWRRRAVQRPALGVVALFLQKGLLNPDFARKILAWQHSGSSIESATRILDQPTRKALCQYLVRAPLSLRRIRWDEGQDTVTWSASPSGFFKGRIRRYSSLDFIALSDVACSAAREAPRTPLRPLLLPRSRNVEEPRCTPLAYAGQLLRQEGGRRPRPFRYPERP